MAICYLHRLTILICKYDAIHISGAAMLHTLIILYVVIVKSVSYRGEALINIQTYNIYVKELEAVCSS